MEPDIYLQNGKNKGNVLWYKRELIKIEIRCNASKRYLFNIKIEDYFVNLKKMGVDISTPITIEYPCSKCKMIEVYEIYPTHYIHTKSYKRN